MDNVIELLKVLPWWPTTVLLLAFIFRSEIRRAIMRLSQLKYKDFEANFKEQLREIEEEVKVATLPSPPTDRQLQPAPVNRNEQLVRLAEISPRASIMEAWHEVEKYAYEAATRHGLSFRHVPTTRDINELVKKGVLPKDILNIYDNLRQLRNNAAHAPEFAVEQAEAEKFIQLASKVADALRAVAMQ
jgi:Domain of unknown function (DUF4145)